MEKTLQIHLQEQREAIAKAIQQGAYILRKEDSSGDQVKNAILQAADIARTINVA